MNAEERQQAVKYLGNTSNKGFNCYTTAAIDGKGNLTGNLTDKQGINNKGNEDPKEFI